MQMTAARPVITLEMTPAERAATEAFHADLVEQFSVNAETMWDAKGRGDTDRYNECVDETRRLYREIKEVEFVLASNVLPF
jgi:hypothetical protein